METKKRLLSRPLWRLTAGELIDLLKESGAVGQPTKVEVLPRPIERSEDRFVHGIQGIAQLFNCSIATANRIKRSGKIDEAISQIGRKIVIDADLALKLASERS